MELNKDFISQMQAILPHDEAERFLEAVRQHDATVSIRANVCRGVRPLAGLARVPWCDVGAYLEKRQPFTFDLDFQGGLYYVQDASSMFLYHVVSTLVTTPVRYLDLCAAPGGKTTAALSALPDGSLVVANEIVSNRARVLRDNVSKWGHSNCVVTSNAPAQLAQLHHYFDVIAADVPCSGEGMFRKDDEAVAQWTPALVEQCAQRQHEIVNDAWQALRPGGLFIYSTCTYNRRENEEMVHYMVEEFGAESVDLNIDPSWHVHEGIDTAEHCYRFMPHFTQGEGLFMCVLRKPDDEPRREPKLRKNKGGKVVKPQPVPKGVGEWLLNPKDFVLSMRDDQVMALHRDFESDYALFEQTLTVIKSGVNLGSVKGKNCVPSHSLALSLQLNREAMPQVEVDYATALAYLRGESMQIAGPKGYVLLTHNGVALGFVNNLGNRANNLLPKGVRILSQHGPDAEPPRVVKVAL